MMILSLPNTLEVNGTKRAINADYRDIIVILSAFADDGLAEFEKTTIMLNNLYVDDWQTFGNSREAAEKAAWFIDGGKEYSDPKNRPRILSWEQDYNLVCSAVNKVAGADVRGLSFLHWWTFLGYFTERGECQISHVMEIREKLAKGKKLDKSEQEILRDNRDIILLRDSVDDEFEKDLWG